MAETVIGSALLAVRQYTVGLVDLLEARFGAIIAVITIRMVLHRLFTERRFEDHFINRALNAQHFVITTLAHCTRPDAIRSIAAAGSPCPA